MSIQHLQIFQFVLGRGIVFEIDNPSYVVIFYILCKMFCSDSRICVDIFRHDV